MGGRPCRRIPRFPCFPRLTCCPYVLYQFFGALGRDRDLHRMSARGASSSTARVLPGKGKGTLTPTSFLRDSRLVLYDTMTPGAERRAGCNEQIKESTMRQEQDVSMTADALSL